MLQNIQTAEYEDCGLFALKDFIWIDFTRSEVANHYNYNLINFSDFNIAVVVSSSGVAT